MLRSRRCFAFHSTGPRGCGHLLGSTPCAFESFTLQAHELMGCTCAQMPSETVVACLWGVLLHARVEDSDLPCPRPTGPFTLIIIER